MTTKTKEWDVVNEVGRCGSGSLVHLSDAATSVSSTIMTGTLGGECRCRIAEGKRWRFGYPGIAHLDGAKWTRMVHPDNAWRTPPLQHHRLGPWQACTLIPF